MADPASLVLGLLPLIAGALKAYRVAWRGLKDFRHYSSQVKRIQKQFDGTMMFFKNELCLLLRDCGALQRYVIEDILDGKAQPNLEDISHEALVRSWLGENYDGCRDTIDMVHSCIKQVQTELRCFEVIESQRNPDEKLKDSIRRLRVAVKVPFNKSKFEGWIGELKSSNADLAALRRQVSELRGLRRTGQSPLLAQGKKLPAEFASFRKVREATISLHRDLEATWRCPEAGHFGHQLKLLLETHFDGQARLELVVMSSNWVPRTLGTLDSLIPLEVRCQNLDWLESGVLTPPTSEDSFSSKPPPKRRRKVRFVDESESRDPPPIINHTLAHRSPSAQEPCHMRDEITCKRLAIHMCSRGRCKGYLETSIEPRYRHNFSALLELPSRLYHQSDIRSIDSLLSHHDSPLSQLTLVDQLKIAKSLAMAILKFESTPWLADYWQLRDILFFHNPTDLRDSLKTLHLSVELNGNTQRDTPMIGTDSQISDAMRTYGIHNLTIYSLAAALLQIGHWVQVPLDDVVALRTIADQGGSKIGKRYDEIAKTCLRCDFGVGSDLRKPRLREAVYNRVIEELSSMIKCLDFDESEESDVGNC